MENNLAIELIGFAAATTAFIVFQSNKRHKMLLLLTFAALLWTVHFYLLGAATGAAINLLNVFRNFTFYKIPLKKRRAFVPIGFGFIYALAAFTTWQGPRSLLALVGVWATTLALWQIKTKHIRLLALIGPGFWLVYGLLSGSYAVVAAEMALSTSIVIGIYRFDIKPFWKKESKNFRAKKKLRWV